MSGLGQLVDGQKGVDNFRSDVFGFGKGKQEMILVENFCCHRKNLRQSLKQISYLSFFPLFY